MPREARPQPQPSLIRSHARDQVDRLGGGGREGSELDIDVLVSENTLPNDDIIGNKKISVMITESADFENG